MKFTTLASNAFDDVIVKLVLGAVVTDSMPSFAVELIGVKNIKSFAPMLALATVTVPATNVALPKYGPFNPARLLFAVSWSKVLYPNAFILCGANE